MASVYLLKVDNQKLRYFVVHGSLATAGLDESPQERYRVR